MKIRTFLPAFAFLPALASAQIGNWTITSTYDYSFSGAHASVHDVETAMEGGSVGGNYGWGSQSSFDADPNGGSYSLTFDTTPFDAFLGDNLSEPLLKDSFAFGVMDALPTDALGQQHLVMLMNPTAAGNIGNIAYGTIFGTSAQPFQYTEEDVIFALEQIHGSLSDAQKAPYRTIVTNFRDQVAKNANVAAGGALGTCWFTPDQGFDIVSFSNGAVIGSGTNAAVTTFTPLPVPEPASLAALGLGLGASALLRRRKRA